jgi:urease accessory protein
LGENQKILNLLRMSDSFFPMGSFAMSQGMEQVINENLLSRENVAKFINSYLEKIWKTFDVGIFFKALEAVEKKDIELLKRIDEICYCSKATEENRSAIVKMGRSMLKVTDFKEDSIGKAYKDLVDTDIAYGSYPIVLALASNQFNYKDLGGLSLLYVNLMEVTASLVRMGVIDYIEAQKILSNSITAVEIEPLKLSDLHQSFPLVDIASMRHESSSSRMFIS